MLTNYLSVIDQRAVMLADTKYLEVCLPQGQCPNPKVPPDMLVILLSRCVDYVHMGFAGLPEQSPLLPQIWRFISADYYSM